MLLIYLTYDYPPPAIQIGFTQPTVSHNETRETFSANIRMLQPSNLTFVVRIQVDTDSDFSIVDPMQCDNERDVVCVVLGPEESEGTIQYEVYDDEIPENTEIFELAIITNPAPNPIFICTNTCNQELQISIFDDDSEFSVT